MGKRGICNWCERGNCWTHTQTHDHTQDEFLEVASNFDIAPHSLGHGFDVFLPLQVKELDIFVMSEKRSGEDHEVYNRLRGSTHLGIVNAKLECNDGPLFAETGARHDGRHIEILKNMVFKLDNEFLPAVYAVIRMMYAFALGPSLRGHMGVECWSGRHRSLAIALCFAFYISGFGCNVRVHMRRSRMCDCASCSDSLGKICDADMQKELKYVFESVACQLLDDFDRLST